jgi:hypothetical protein
VHLHLHRIDDGDVHRYFPAADAVVLPYRRILNSCAAMFDRPVGFPAAGSLVEPQQMLGRDWA